MLDKVMTAGIDKSMPRAISTIVSPIAAMPRKAANGMIARNVEGRRLRGTMTAQTTRSPTIAIQIATKRTWNSDLRAIGADSTGGVTAVVPAESFIARFHRRIK